MAAGQSVRVVDAKSKGQRRGRVVEGVAGWVGDPIWCSAV